jgi:hypothetical protein
MAVSITEILGSDSISGSRLTINSNNLLLQNWINSFESTFGINTSTGVLDLTQTSAGQVLALSGSFNTVSTPASGTPLASINSSGNASFVQVNTARLIVTSTTTLSGAITISNSLTQSTGVTASFSGGVYLGGSTNSGSFVHGNYSAEVYGNNWSRSGNTLAAGAVGGTSAFAVNSTGVGGNGIVTALNSPYVVTGKENLIYAAIGTTGFFMRVSSGDGATASTLPAGFRLTIINTENVANGLIYTGVTGTTSTYYTGFNTDSTRGGWPSTGITLGSTARPYRTSLVLQWEPRIAGDQASQKGSWVLISGTNVASY